MRQQSNFSVLCRGHILPKEVRDKDGVVRFLEAVEQFERIIRDSGLVRLERLTTEEITGGEKEAGLVEKYFSLSQEDTPRWRTSGSGARKCASATSGSRCIRSPTRTTCPARYRPTDATRNSPRTAATAASPSPPPWG